MALSNYNPKILNFLYELTKLKRFMSQKEIADNINLDSGKVSPRTVQRWFSFLKQKYYHPESKTNDKFDYFPTFFYEKLGLTRVFIIEEIHRIEDLRPSPFLDYAAWLYNFGNFNRALFTSYLIPKEYLKEFENQWRKNKIDKSGENNFYKASKSFYIYSPWHETIDKEGVFHPEDNNEKEIESQIKQFEYYLDNLPHVRSIPEVKRNPLIIPTLFEQCYQYHNSTQIWQAVKNSLGDRVWDYVKKSRGKTDGIGIKRVQQAIKDVYKFGFFYQMRVVYMPLELNHNFFVYIVLKFKNKKDIVKNVKILALNSVYITVYPKEDNRILLISLVNNKSFNNITSILENLNVEKMFLLQHEKSLSLLTNPSFIKFDYTKLFDPKKVRWKY